jgi:hypothetical protein
LPISDPANKAYASELITRVQPTTVLDVGPGVGTYGSMIREQMEVERLDAVEVWAPYIERYRLQEIYDRVMVCDVRFWNEFSYDVVILGDVLEHLSFDESVDLWQKISEQAGAVLLSIPIVHYPQGSLEGNPYEAHLVTDWSTSKVLKHLGGIQEYREFDVTGVFLAVFRGMPASTPVSTIGPRLRIQTRVREEDFDSAVTPASPATVHDGNGPLVSCICPTYNRPPSHQHLVEEAIESFLRQTYPNKELILLNDCGAQELVCDVPGVRVINVRDRFPSLGDKRNAGVLLSAGELIAPWDDDDISLPWRLSLLVERLGQADYLNSDKCWWMDSNKLRVDPLIGGGLAKAIFRRRAFDAAGGYPSITNGEDAALERALFALGNHVDSSMVELQRCEWYYIYRWGISQLHMSGRYDDSAYSEIGARPVEPGRFVLHPHWRRNYVADTRMVLQERIADHAR